MQKATITRAASSVANRTARASNQATLASQTQPSAFAESDFTRVRAHRQPTCVKPCRSFGMMRRCVGAW
eukprot:1381955-Rhodomonas_salina.2